uniref:Uncharacterized protein n=1 Tax=Zea mays TaxID=4577 RepID=A0A804M554_MAIZE
MGSNRMAPWLPTNTSSETARPQSPTQGWFRLLKGNALILRLLKNLQDDVQEQSVGSKCKEKTQLQKLLAIDYTR